ncbi:MAG: EAL domain-containing protein [Marinobacter adhaerens]
MSLVKQLWLATSFLILTAFVASLAASLISAQAYYEEQLALKNIDSANSLAITLSHTEKETALLRSFLDAQFATGHYQRIRLTMPGGTSLDLQSDTMEHQAPGWFRAIFPLEVPAGVATVSDGWVNFGTLSIESDTTYAQTSLWVTAQRLLLWLALVALAAGLAGSWLVRRISRPLNEVVQQAEAIGEKRFIVSSEPRTTEFQRVVRAMNKLSRRVEHILETEARALADMRQKALHDPVTDVGNREFFTSKLDSLIDDPDTDARHTIALLRIQNLAELNAEHGREVVNHELRRFCQEISEAIDDDEHLAAEAFIGRLNGSDFGVLLTEFHDAGLLRKTLSRRVTGPAGQAPNLSICTFQPGSSHAGVLMKVDHLLAQAEQTQERVVIDEEDLEDIPFKNATEWREAIDSALQKNALKALLHPLIGRDGKPLHHEAKVRLQLNGNWRAAGYFLPWGRRLGLLPDVDLAMVKHLTQSTTQSGNTPIVIHISRESLLNDQARHHILELLEHRSHPSQAFRLELPESTLAIGELALGTFIHEAQARGCEVGVSGIGQNLERISRVHELGLDYIKTDPVYAQRLASDPATQQYLQRLTALAHSIGLKVYLAGARSEECVQSAWDVGVDGVTGPGVKTSD